MDERDDRLVVVEVLGDVAADVHVLRGEVGPAAEAGLRVVAVVVGVDRLVGVRDRLLQRGLGLGVAGLGRLPLRPEDLLEARRVGHRLVDLVGGVARGGLELGLVARPQLGLSVGGLLVDVHLVGSEHAGPGRLVERPRLGEQLLHHVVGVGPQRDVDVHPPAAPAASRSRSRPSGAGRPCRASSARRAWGRGIARPAAELSAPLAASLPPRPRRPGGAAVRAPPRRPRCPPCAEATARCRA